MSVLASLALAGALITGAYQDVSLGWQAQPPALKAPAWLGPPQPGQVNAHKHGVRMLAFATGECGAERWGPGIDTEAFAAVVRALPQPYVISTGGEADSFHCETAEGMRRFLARYDSPQLLGIDFDIERNQTPQQVDDLVQRAAELHRLRPTLRLSFTLATHGASDGSGRTLNALGQSVLARIRHHGLQGHAVLNLMVMNYGPADPRWCVVKSGRCDMGASALQAARNLHQTEAWPYAQIALTAMPGENDVAGNVFTLADAEVLAKGARQLGLEAVHWWSVDRDQPCQPGAPRVSPRCHALPGVPAGAFGRVLGR